MTQRAMTQHATTQYTMSEARTRFAEVLDAVEKTHDRIEITRNGLTAAVLISSDDLESMEETLAILSNPETVADIREGLEDVARGDVLRGEEALAALREIAAYLKVAASAP